jgi:hypothetical protein
MVRTIVAGFAVAATCSIAAQAADVPYTILLDGRPLTARTSGTGAIARNGVIFVDVVVATKTFSGLLTFGDAGNTVRLSLRNQTAIFTVGSRTAQIGGKPVTLPGAPFKSDGDVYVPLSTVARLGGATVNLNTNTHVARLNVRPFATMPTSMGGATTPAGAATASAAVLTLTPSATVDAQGALHAHLEVANGSKVPVSLEFPNGGRVAFVLSRDGTIVWDSTRGMVFNMIVGFTTVPPGGSASFDGEWPQYATQPAGTYRLTARLLTRSPLVSPSVPVPPVPHPASS